MPLIPLLFRQLPASWREEIGEAKNVVSNSYPLHWLSGFSLLIAAPHAFFCCLLPVGGLERPPRFPWQRSGVAPDHFGALPASKLHVAPCATSMPPTISPRPWVTLTVTGMVTCVFHAPVTFPHEKRPLNLIRILPALDRRGSRTQKM